ncbi:MAG: LysR family transcriptional regulator [Bacteroidales bacterium]|nr:LysR family transcriptional regulator [Bacteroidales bacterium]
MIEDFRLRVFKTVATRGSFTLAAKELGISQPAVSQNIAELEKSLGCELFMRNRGAVTLTASGKSFLEYADKILYWYHAASNLFSEGSQLKKTTLRICANTFIAEAMLPKVVNAISAVSKNVIFDIFTDSDKEFDVRLSCHDASKPLSLMESRLAVTTLNASAMTSNERFSHVESLFQIPDEVSFAVWSGYSGALSPDIVSKAKIYSDSPSLICEKVSSSPLTIGILPERAGSEKLLRLPIIFEALKTDILMETSETLTDDALIGLIKKSL